MLQCHARGFTSGFRMQCRPVLAPTLADSCVQAPQPPTAKLSLLYIADMDGHPMAWPPLSETSKRGRRQTARTKEPRIRSSHDCRAAHNQRKPCKGKSPFPPRRTARTYQPVHHKGIRKHGIMYNYAIDNILEYIIVYYKIPQYTTNAGVDRTVFFWGSTWQLSRGAQTVGLHGDHAKEAGFDAFLMSMTRFRD